MRYSKGGVTVDAAMQMTGWRRRSWIEAFGRLLDRENAAGDKAKSSARDDDDEED